MRGLVYFLCSGAHPLLILCLLSWCRKLLVRLQNYSLRWSSGGKAEDKPLVAWRFGPGSAINTAVDQCISIFAWLKMQPNTVFAGGSRCRCSQTTGVGRCFANIYRWCYLPVEEPGSSYAACRSSGFIRLVVGAAEKCDSKIKRKTYISVWTHNWDSFHSGVGRSI